MKKEGPTSPPRRRRTMPAHRFAQLADLAVAAVFLVVVSGAVVRLTDSGLGCDGWPDCSESVFPEREFHATIEFVNRVVALIGIIITIIVAAAVRYVERRPRWLGRAAALTAIGMVAQIPLGGLTVLLDLHPLAVMAHFLLALVVLGLAVYVALAARRHASGKQPQAKGPMAQRATLLATAILPLTAALVVTGAFVTAAGPHPGGDGVRRLGDFWGSLEVHVWVTGAFGIAFAGLLVLLWLGRRESRTALGLAVAVLVVLIAQMTVGEVQRNNGLPWQLVLAHVAMGSAVWAGMVGVAVDLVQRAGWPERDWLPGQYTLRHR